MDTSISLYDFLLKAKDKQRALHYYTLIKSRTNGFLQMVNMELSPVCNLNCEVCYIRMSEKEVRESGEHVMRFDEWKYYIDGLHELNVPYIILTGGECMLHPDFMEIYKYIYDLGIQVILKTNCSCLTDGILDMLCERPPDNIAVTVYGASRETYERFCGNGAAYDAVMKNIDLLVERGMLVSVQVTLGKDNQDDLLPLYDYFRKKDIKWSYSNQLMQFGKCDKNKIDLYETDPRQAKDSLLKKQDREMGKPERNGIDYANYVFPSTDSEVTEKGMLCGATQNFCAITWKGMMCPCVGFSCIGLDPKENGGVAECWKKLHEWGKTVPQLVECQNCIFKNECNNSVCVSIHYNDTKEFGKLSPRLCYKLLYPEEAAKLQAEYDRRQALKTAREGSE